MMPLVTSGTSQDMFTARGASAFKTGFLRPDGTDENK